MNEHAITLCRERSLQEQPVIPTSATVLLVEDNPGDIDLWNLVLEELGLMHLVSIARTGVEALGQIEEKSHTIRPFRLVITDRYLPMLDGPALIARMQQTPLLRNMPVVMLTGGALPNPSTSPCPCYQKPSGYGEWRDLVETLRSTYSEAFTTPRD